MSIDRDRTISQTTTSSQLISKRVSLRPQNLGLRLDFTFGPEVGDVAIEFDRILHLVISRPINSDDENYCFWVGKVELRNLAENAETFLASLSYPFNFPPNTDMGNARNNINILSSDVIIACGMGTGTASEIALALKANKQVILLNNDAESKLFFKKIATSNIFVVNSVVETIA